MTDAAPKFHRMTLKQLREFFSPRPCSGVWTKNCVSVIVDQDYGKTYTVFLTDTPFHPKRKGGFRSIARAMAYAAEWDWDIDHIDHIEARLRISLVLTPANQRDLSKLTHNNGTGDLRMIFFDDRFESGERVYSSTVPGGEIGVNLTKGGGAVLPLWAVTAYLETSRSIMELIMTTDALRREGINVSRLSLTIPYFPYARQDRVCHPGESLSAKVMADLINGLGYGKVVVYDPHSDVVPALLDNVEVVTPNTLINDVFLSFDRAPVLVSPDAGAEKKVAAIAKARDMTMITATKTRDPHSGKITAVHVSGRVDPDTQYLVVDDICDGGGTFLALSEAMRYEGAKRMDLFVTHVIFSNLMNAVSAARMENLQQDA